MTSDALSVYDMLRDGLIWGRWKSGERLKPQHLKTEIGCTSAALREALLRLAGEGFVVSERNHGFRAVAHAKQTFHEAAHLRLVLESEALSLAIRSGDFDWELNVSAAYKKLAYIEDQMAGQDDIGAYVQRWSRQDWGFHQALLSACGSALLMQSYKAVFDTFRMYAASEIKNFGFSAEMTIVEHKAIYEAAVNRDEAACLAAIEQHLAIYQGGDRALKPQSSKDLVAAGARQLRIA